MKKLFAILLMFILIGTISATAIPLSVQKTVQKPIPTKSETGTFEGEIGYIKDGEWNAVGELSGTYKLRARFGTINGQWIITQRDQSGTLRAIFGRNLNIILGRIKIDETGKIAPIIGFIGFREETNEFGGRFMSIIGPALYFKGTYQEN